MDYSHVDFAILCYETVKLLKNKSFSSIIKDFREDVLSTGIFTSINPDDITSTDYPNMRVLVKGESKYRQYDGMAAYQSLRGLTKTIPFGFIDTQYLLYSNLFDAAECDGMNTVNEMHSGCLNFEELIMTNLFFAERSVVYAQRMIQTLENTAIVLRSVEMLKKEEMDILIVTCEMLFNEIVAKLREILIDLCSKMPVEKILEQFQDDLSELVVQHLILVMLTSAEKFLKKHLTDACSMLLLGITSSLETLGHTAQHLLEDHRALLILHSTFAEIRFSITLPEEETVSSEAQVKLQNTKRRIALTSAETF